MVFLKAGLECEDAEIVGISGEPVHQFLERGHGR